MANKNILFIITKSEIGGAQRFVHDQIKVLTSNNFNSFLITNKSGWLTNKSSEYVKSIGLHVGIESKFSLSFCFFLYNFIKINKIDLIICNSANAGFYGRIICFIANIKSIYVSHGWSSVYNGGKFSFLLNFIERLLSYIGTSVLCVSDEDLRIGLKVIKITESKLFYLPNHIFPITAKDFKVIKEEKVLKILTVSRLEHPKRVDLLIKAVSSIDFPISLTIVGNGKNFNFLNCQILNDNIKNVNLVGEICDFKDFFDYDVFALISESEGLPISALEAMSSGLALLLSNVGGCSSLIRENGVLVENTEQSIKLGLIKCSNNLLQYQLNSLKHFDKNYNLSNNNYKYLNYYKSLL